MNYFTHVLPFLDRDPHFIVGCCVPDWLSAADRKCRSRQRLAEPFLESDDHAMAQLAAGIIQHHRDDHWFHQTRAFTELCMVFTVELRPRFASDAGFRASVLGHILIELLLDALLNQRHPGQLARFYEIAGRLNPDQLQASINQMVTRPSESIAPYIRLFHGERYLFDYNDDERLVYRINHVLRRVKLDSVGQEVLDWLPSARRRVYERAPELLCEYPIELG